ncbi:MAG: hypothetical protein V4484_03875 [Pseudomonadota bacterium]
MKARKFLTASLTAVLFVTSAQGAPITQNEAANQSVSAWESYGELALQQWNGLNFAPWDTAEVDANQASSNNPAARPKTDNVSLNTAAQRISEPASELLMLAALGGLAIMIRRKMPE